MIKQAAALWLIVGSVLLMTTASPIAAAEDGSYKDTDPADFSPAQRRQLLQDINAIKADREKLSQQMSMYRRGGMPVPPKLVAEDERLKTRLAELVEIRQALGPAPTTETVEPTKPTNTTTDTVTIPPPPTTGPTYAEITAALENARQILENQKEFDESVEAAARAMLTGDAEERKAADRRKYSAFSRWASLRRNRPTVTLNSLLSNCPAEHRGDWANPAGWTDAQQKAFNAWTDRWTEICITIEGEVDSASFRRPDRAEVKTTMRLNIDGATVLVPTVIKANSTRAFMLEKAQRGDRLKGEAVIRKTGDLTAAAASATLTLEVELETAELYRNQPGSREPQRVWPDMNAVASRTVSLRRSFERENTRGDDLYQRARTDASMHDQAVRAYIAYEDKHVARPFIWHPRVTVEQWLAGCPDDAHGPWESLDRWTNADKQAFARWIGGSFDLKLLTDLKVDQIGEERASNRVIMSRQITIGRVPITLILKDYAKRKIPVAEGETFYATLSLGSYNKTEFEDGRIVLRFNANLGRCSEKPLGLDGKPK
jgi:hypothetical protein